MKTVFVVAACVFLAVGCGDSSGPKQIAVAEAGTYTLVAVNDMPLPAVVLETSTLVGEILSGTIVIRADSTFTETRQARITSNGVASTTNGTTNGTFSISAGTATFRVSGTTPTTYTGSFGPGTLTATVQGTVLKYQR
jgi:hypothetical protein